MERIALKFCIDCEGFAGEVPKLDEYLTIARGLL